MTEPSTKKEGFKKCRSATFSIDGFSFTIGEKSMRTSWLLNHLERQWKPMEANGTPKITPREMFSVFTESTQMTVANETGDKNSRPLARFTRSKSQNSLWNTIISGLNLKEKQKPAIVTDPRSPEEILADELPQIDSPDAVLKTSTRFDGYYFKNIFTFF